MVSSHLRLTVLLLLMFGLAGQAQGWQENATPSEDDLRFGSMQIEQLASDRPDIAECLRVKPGLRTWLIESFAGVRHDRKIHWDRANPNSGRDGEYQAGTGETMLVIRISDKKDLRGFDRLTVLLFEVCNSESRPIVTELLEQASKGKITRQQFAVKILETEYVALLKCRNLLIRHSIPFENNPYVAYTLNAPKDLNSFMSQPERKRALEYFQLKYDRIVQERCVPSE